MRETIHLAKPFKTSAVAASSNIPVLGRTRIVASLQQQASLQQGAQPGPPPRFPLLKAFLSQFIGPWIFSYLKNIFRCKYKPYPYYDQLAIDRGVYPLRPAVAGAPIRLALAGDWATGTQEAWEIGQAISQWSPDYTVHLGDVYYVGDEPEVDENFLGTSKGQYAAVKWPAGQVGEFALLGNHEMYAGGKPYFESMLPTLRTGTGRPQKASFFGLETDHWRILALDTGYNSAGFPLLGSIPILKKLPFLAASCRLEDRLIEWLRTVIQPAQNRKPTLLLSHHQYYSAFGEEISGTPAGQLAEFFQGQEVVWIWAHEHRVALYDVYEPTKGLRAFGRCLGNGGMPVETGAPSGSAPVTFYDPRDNYPLDNQTFAGWNGWLQLTLDGPAMTLEYRDIRNNSLFTESFHGDPGGALRYTFTPPAGEITLKPRL